MTQHFNSKSIVFFKIVIIEISTPMQWNFALREVQIIILKSYEWMNGKD